MGLQIKFQLLSTKCKRNGITRMMPGSRKRKPSEAQRTGWLIWFSHFGLMGPHEEEGDHLLGDFHPRGLSEPTTPPALLGCFSSHHISCLGFLYSAQTYGSLTTC